MDREKRHPSLAITPILVFVLGIKLVLVKCFGSITPFWDQWDAEGASVYKPFLENRLTIYNLFSSHNEHRIFFTRVLGLVELELFGVWSPQLQMAVNALLHVAVIGFFLWSLVAKAAPIARIAILSSASLLFSIPFGWENTVAAFQSQFYFALGFSLIALRLFQTAPAVSVRWFAAVLFSIAAYFSESSGAMTILALMAVAGLQLFLGERARSTSEFLALAAMTGLCFVQVAFITHVPLHDSLRAHGILEFAGALLKASAWPLPGVFAVVVNAPILILLRDLIRSAPARTAYQWWLVSLLFWLGAQWVALSYGRGMAPTVSRYTDILVVGPMLNVAALCHLFRDRLAPLLMKTERIDLLRRHPRLSSTITTVAVALVAFATFSAVRNTYSRGEAYVAETRNLRAFLQTGDISHLENKPNLSVPYPDAARLASLASDPTIRSILVPDLTGQPLRRDLLLPRWTTQLFRDGLGAVLNLGWLFSAIGLGVLARRWLLARSKQGGSAPGCGVAGPVEGDTIAPVSPAKGASE
jgi:hypothetical protein